METAIFIVRDAPKVYTHLTEPGCKMSCCGCGKTSQYLAAKSPAAAAFERFLQ
jgi:hypothetical protein